MTTPQNPEPVDIAALTRPGNEAARAEHARRQEAHGRDLIAEALRGPEKVVPLRAPVCPECRTGKHSNCDGTAFDEAADDIVECVCPPAFGHRERTPQR